MPKVRFVDPAYKNFSGYYGQNAFKDGVSVNDLNQSEIARLSAVIRIKAIDEEGAESECGIAYDMVANRRAGAPVEATYETGSDNFKAEENQPDVNAASAQEPKEEVEDDLTKAADDIEKDLASEDVKPDAKVYTREELEDVADAGGIKGLRAIAGPMGVKDSSIDGLINEILAKQEEVK